MNKKKSNATIGLKFALKGMYTFFKEGTNAKIHLLAALAVIILGFVLELNLTEWLWIALAIALVIVTEMLNTSIELLCDLVIPKQNENAGKLKDIAAGAVLVAAIFAIVVASIVFGQKIV